MEHQQWIAVVVLYEPDTRAHSSLLLVCPGILVGEGSYVTFKLGCFVFFSLSAFWSSWSLNLIKDLSGGGHAIQEPTASVDRECLENTFWDKKKKNLLRKLFAPFIVFNWLPGPGCIQPFLDEFLRAVLVYGYFLSVRKLWNLLNFPFRKTLTGKESQRISDTGKRSRVINRRVLWTHERCAFGFPEQSNLLCIIYT